MRLIELKVTDSTNEEAKRVPFEHGTCVTALRQTAGKGRRGKSWLSEEGKGLYASFLLQPVRGPVSVAFGVAVYNALNELQEGLFYLKWPNDVYAKGKKVAGVLVESLKGRLIVGVGINLSYDEEELRSLERPATSLKALKVPFNRRELLRKLWDEVLKVHRQLKEGDFKVETFEKSCPLIGKRVEVEERGQLFSGIALGLDRDGALIVETETGIKRLFSGEVSLRGV
jgi:BirA family biotin operon repressor/biotin-[acetyl-CoA-carboxylase] ligase